MITRRGLVRKDVVSNIQTAVKKGKGHDQRKKAISIVLTANSEQV